MESYMENIVTIDMEVGSFYSAVKDSSHVSMMSIMEEKLMAFDLTGLSLSLALLETVDPDYYKSFTGDYTDKATIYKRWQADARQHISDPEKEKDKVEAKAKAQKKLMEVQTSLYKNLYYIIEDYKETHNNALNDAIGKALAIVVKNHGEIATAMTASMDDKDIQRFREDIQSLINVLEPVVTEAVKAAERSE
jgi:hypothetical protein